jgi:hypothetical protein
MNSTLFSEYDSECLAVNQFNKCWNFIGKEGMSSAVFKYLKHC